MHSCQSSGRPRQRLPRCGYARSQTSDKKVRRDASTSSTLVDQHAHQHTSYPWRNPACACSAAEKTISTYKAAADAITAEHAALQETAFASPRSKAARLESMRVRDLEAQNAELLARVEELESAQAEERAASDAARREMEKRHEAELNRRIKDATAIADRDLAELRQEGEMVSLRPTSSRCSSLRHANSWMGLPEQSR